MTTPQQGELVGDAEFNRILEKLFPDSSGKGQSDAARFLEITDRSIRRYASGAQEVPAPLAKFLRTMIALKLTPADVDAALAGLVKTAPKRRAKA